jgi:hypothetical protein
MHYANRALTALTATMVLMTLAWVWSCVHHHIYPSNRSIQNWGRGRNR